VNYPSLEEGNKKVISDHNSSSKIALRTKGLIFKKRAVPETLISKSTSTEWSFMQVELHLSSWLPLFAYALIAELVSFFMPYLICQSSQVPYSDSESVPNSGSP